MKNEGKNAKHGFKIMTAVITVCAVLCTVFSAMSLVLQYKDHIMLKKYEDFVSYENSTKNADEKDGFYLVTKEAKPKVSPIRPQTPKQRVRRHPLPQGRLRPRLRSA